MAEESTLFLLDGAALAYRSFFAFIRNPLSTARGRNVSAIYGFATALLDLLDRERPKYLGVVFDLPGPTFRNDLYGEYKATRQKMPEELAGQLDDIRLLVEAMAIPYLTLDGFEADDVIGALSLQAEREEVRTFVVSRDKDLAQLVSDKVLLYDKKGDRINVMGPAEVEAKWGVDPGHMIDFLALTGDASDNIPGIPGVGPKTAIKLLAQFGSLESVLRDFSKIKARGLRKKVEAGLELARLSYKLVTIDRQAPISLDLAALRVGSPNREAVRELFSRCEFQRLTERFSPSRPEIQRDYCTVQNRESLQALVSELREADEVAFDLETTSLCTRRAELVAFSFSTAEGKAWCVPCAAAREGPPDLFSAQKDATWAATVLDLLRPLLEDPGVKKGGQNIRYDTAVLAHHGIQVRGVHFDTMIESYLFDPDRRQHGIDATSLHYLRFKKIPTSALIGKGKKQKSMRDVPLADLARYACEDADICFRLHRFFLPKIQSSNLEGLYREVEIPLLAVLNRMEDEGVKVDRGRLSALSATFASRAQSLEEEIFRLAGESFNLNSPKQLQAIVYGKLKIHEQLGVRNLKKTSTGFSTAHSVLERLTGHPMIGKIMEYRHMTKLKGAYTDALPRLIDPNTGMIHTSFNQTVAATGRLSSSNPNLQNIPIRTETGREIRNCFVPREPGWKLLSADYSQIELRVLAHLSGDADLIAAFRAGRDIHATTAARIFGVEQGAVTGEQRSRAKAINFGILYGMGPQRLAREQEMTLDEAKEFIEQYFEKFPTIQAFLESCREAARRTRTVRTILGRLRRIDSIDSSNRAMQALAENIATNTPIQGSAADLIKLAMIAIDRELQTSGLQAKMILQVHDELVFDLPDEEVGEVSDLVKRQMEQVMPLKVPLKVDMGVGDTWLEAH